MAKQNKQIIITLFVILIISLSICTVFICTHDDYFIPFGDDIDGSVLFAKELGNGRYLGNFLGNWLSQKYIVSVIIRGISIVLLSSLLCYLSGSFTWQRLSLAFTLVMFPGIEVFSQSYGWAHGFYNYFPPVLLAFSGAAVLKGNISKNYQAISAFLLIVFGVSQMLFSENSTVICILLAFWLCVEYHSDRKRATLAYIYAISGTIGAAIMFIAPRLAGVADKMQDYREISRNVLTTIKYNLVDISQTLMQGGVLWLCWIALIFLKTRDQKNKTVKPLILIIILLWGFAYSVSREFLSRDIFQNAGVFCSGAFIGLIIYCSIKIFWKDSRFINSSIIFILAVISMLELLVVQPIGPRCMYITVMLLNLTFLNLLGKNKTDISRVLLVGLCSGVVYLAAALFNLIPLFYQNQMRIVDIRNQMKDGNKIIKVLPIQNSKYAWNANELYGFPYTFNYGDPEEMTFILAADEDS